MFLKQSVERDLRAHRAQRARRAACARCAHCAPGLLGDIYGAITS